MKFEYVLMVVLLIKLVIVVILSGDDILSDHDEFGESGDCRF
jgi:hypothetical protein